MEECNVCYEDRNKFVSCPFCEFTSCSICARKYILNGTTTARCMSCNTGWIDTFLSTWNAKKWVFGTTGDYRKFKENLIYEREMALMEETLEIVERNNRVKELGQEIEAVHRQIGNLWNVIDQLEQAQRTIGNGGGSSSREKYLFPCPMDDCVGRVKSETVRCVVCCVKFCRKCRYPKEDKHICNKDDIESVKLIKNDTHPCPRCSVAIFKIDGCDQMWCTQCHVAFSWRTGAIITGTIHNPHAAEWNRRNGEEGRNVNDVPCGGLIHNHILMRKLNNVKCNRGKMSRIRDCECKNCDIFYIILKIHRRIFEMDILEVDENMNYIRMKLLEKTITKDEFKKQVYNRERQNGRKRVVNDTKILLRNLSTDRFRHIVETEIPKGKKIKLAKNTITYLEGLKTYCNEILMDEMPKYGAKKIPQWGDDWILS